MGMAEIESAIIFGRQIGISSKSQTRQAVFYKQKSALKEGEKILGTHLVADVQEGVLNVLWALVAP